MVDSCPAPAGLTVVGLVGGVKGMHAIDMQHLAAFRYILFCFVWWTCYVDKAKHYFLVNYKYIYLSI